MPVRYVQVTFVASCTLVLRCSPSGLLEKHSFEKGEHLSGVPRAHVVMVGDFFYECFDLVLPSGDIIINIRYKWITLLEDE